MVCLFGDKVIDESIVKFFLESVKLNLLCLGVPLLAGPVQLQVLAELLEKLEHILRRLELHGSLE